MAWTGGSALEAAPGPAGDAEAVGYIVGGVFVGGHGDVGGPGEVIVQGLAQGVVAGQSGVLKSEVEAGDGVAVHFFVGSVAAVHADDRGFVAAGSRW